MNSLSRTQKPRAGFTLLEVMVVIVILGVLASLVVPNLLGNKEKADRQKAISDIVALENALDMYRLDNGRYPTTEQGLEALIQQPANMADSRNYRTGGYIKRLPKDPWGNDYQYLSPGEKGLFDVYTLGADGQENGEGAGADNHHAFRADAATTWANAQPAGVPAGAVVQRQCGKPGAERAQSEPEK